ncbi:MAG: hypothetical protein ABSA53_37065 [Streptosporangiaceae bacterium]
MVVLSGQQPLRAFLAEAAASVRRVYGGPVSYSALPFERVDPVDVVGVNYYRQQAPAGPRMSAAPSMLPGVTTLHEPLARVLGPKTGKALESLGLHTTTSRCWPGSCR